MKQLSNNLQSNISQLKQTFSGDNSITFREFSNKSAQIDGVLIFADTMTNAAVIDEYILQPILDDPAAQPGENLAEAMARSVVNINDVSVEEQGVKITSAVLNGDTVILFQGCPKALICNTRSMQSRSVSAPENEKSMFGPKESYTELLFTNMGLLRRRVKDPSFKIKTLSLGRVTKTSACICYIENIADQKLIKQVEQRLAAFEIDGLLDSHYLEEIICDNPLSPFKSIGSTERPDVTVAAMLEGRVAILVDGSPYALTLPFLFLENFQATDDYYYGYFYAGFVRILRYLAFIIAFALPGIYIAFLGFHMEMIPMELLVSISKSVSGVPFPNIIEALVLMIIFDLIRESGARTPAIIGTTASIVGGIVLGQSIVSAKIVSAPMIIIVATSGICSVILPKMAQEIVVLRTVFFIGCSAFGLYGLTFCTIITLVYLCSLKSFDCEYMSYFDFNSKQQMKDTFIRAPWWSMLTRPSIFNTRNKTRFKKN